MDYRKLLKTYMGHVMDMEGISYADFCVCSAEEASELAAIEAEILADDEKKRSA